jgi:uncharacterized glyoxalase superfamily protein PhnB
LGVVDIIPILNVTDIEASFVWFEKLGFTRGFAWRDQPDAAVTFGSVHGGESEIFLCQGAQGGRGDSGTWMSIFLDDVDAAYATCEREGIEVTMPPEDEPWGVREMHVRHPDGHILRIGTGVGEA